jgi:hypothetical protein
MSTTEIYSFDKEGNASFYDDVHNAWRGAMAVWKIVEERHLTPYLPKFPFPSQFSKPSRTTAISDETAMNEIWGLWDNPNVPENDRIVLGTTFDKVLVKKEDIPKVIEAFRSFGGETSLPEQADILQALFEDDDCIAVGWNQTSVNGDTWSNYRYNEETGECDPYNCLTQDEHWWLFEELNKESEAK